MYGSDRPESTHTTGVVTRWLRRITVVAAVGIVAFVGIRFPALPDQIPTHFGVTGQPDAWGPRATILFLPAIMIVLVGAMTWLSTRPDLFNYPVFVTERNAPAIYREGERMMVWCTAAIVVLFGAICLAITGVPSGLFMLVGGAGVVASVVAGFVRVALADRRAEDGSPSA